MDKKKLPDCLERDLAMMDIIRQQGEQIMRLTELIKKLADNDEFVLLTIKNLSNNIKTEYGQI